MGLVEIPQIGSRVILSQKSRHAGDVLLENGKIWIVLEYRPSVLAFAGKPGILVESIITQCWRWIQVPEDRTFYCAEIRR